MLARRIALGLLVVALASACQSREARFGKVLVFGKPKDAVKLDPAQINEAESSVVTQTIFDTLVRFAPGKTTLAPGLATSWTVSPDAKTYTFKLRQGVKFHDGTPFDAEAARFTFERQRDAKHPGHVGVFEYWLNFFEPVVAGTEAPAPDRFVVHLKAPDATFLTNVALYALAIVSPASVTRYGADVVRHPVGTGPFRFESWVPGQKIVLKANPDYWGGKPKIDTLVFKPVPENSVRVMELESGAIQGMSGITPDDAARLERQPRVELYSGAGLNVSYLVFNTTKKPLNDPRVRRALTLALDTPAMLKAFFNGGAFGALAKNPLPPTMWGYAADVPAPSPDPAAARRLLAEAGYAKGLSLDLWALPIARPYLPQGQRVAEAIQAQWAGIGVKAPIRSFEWGTYLDKLANGDHQVAFIGWNADTGDPDNFLYTFFASANARRGSATNYAFWKDPQVDGWLRAARATPDQAKRAGYYEAVQRRVHEQAPIAPLFHGMQLVAFDRSVKGFVLSPLGDLDLGGVDVVPENRR